jgi:hypothetical protein
MSAKQHKEKAMEGKIVFFMDNMKNINSSRIVDALKKNQKMCTLREALNCARKAVDSAYSSTKEELHFLSGRINFLEQRTIFEIEKMITRLVVKVLDGQPDDVLTTEIQEEIMGMIKMQNKGKSVISTLKRLNLFILNHVPTNFQSLKNLKQNIAQTLISEAKKRISERNIIDVQLLPERKPYRKPRYQKRF